MAACRAVALMAATLAPLLVRGWPNGNRHALPSLSIMVPTNGRPEFIEHVLNAIRRQSYPAELINEVVVVDDSPPSLRVPMARGTDATNATVVNLPGLKVVFVMPPLHDGQLSVGAKRNLALSYATGEVMCHWDDDDFYGAERLREQVLPLMRGEAEVTVLEHQVTYFMVDDELYLADFHWKAVPSWGPHFGTLTYWRALWEKGVHFTDNSEAEDYGFAQQAVEQMGARVVALPSVRPGPLPNRDRVLFACVRHGSNTWLWAGGGKEKEAHKWAMVRLETYEYLSDDTIGFSDRMRASGMLDQIASRRAAAPAPRRWPHESVDPDFFTHLYYPGSPRRHSRRRLAFSPTLETDAANAWNIRWPDGPWGSSSGSPPQSLEGFIDAMEQNGEPYLTLPTNPGGVIAYARLGEWVNLSVIQYSSVTFVEAYPHLAVNYSLTETVEWEDPTGGALGNETITIEPSPLYGGVYQAPAVSLSRPLLVAPYTTLEVFGDLIAEGHSIVLSAYAKLLVYGDLSGFGRLELSEHSEMVVGNDATGALDSVLSMIAHVRVNVTGSLHCRALELGFHSRTTLGALVASELLLGEHAHLFVATDATVNVQLAGSPHAVLGVGGDLTIEQFRPWGFWTNIYVWVMGQVRVRSGGIDLYPNTLLVALGGLDVYGEVILQAHARIYCGSTMVVRAQVGPGQWSHWSGWALGLWSNALLNVTGNLEVNGSLGLYSHAAAWVGDAVMLEGDADLFSHSTLNVAGIAESAPNSPESRAVKVTLWAHSGMHVNGGIEVMQKLSVHENSDFTTDGALEVGTSDPSDPGLVLWHQATVAVGRLHVQNGVQVFNDATLTCRGGATLEGSGATAPWPSISYFSDSLQYGDLQGDAPYPQTSVSLYVGAYGRVEVGARLRVSSGIAASPFSEILASADLKSRHGDFYVGHHTLINVTGVLDCERMSLQRYAEIFVLAAATVRDNLRLEYGSTFQATAVIAGDAYVHVRGGAHLAAKAGRITAGVLQLDSLASIYSTERVVVTAALNAAPHFTTSGCGGTVTAGTASCTVSMLGYRNTKSVNCVSYIDGWYNDSISVNLQNADQLDCPYGVVSPYIASQLGESNFTAYGLDESDLTPPAHRYPPDNYTTLQAQCLYTGVACVGTLPSGVQAADYTHRAAWLRPLASGSCISSQSGQNLFSSSVSLSPTNDRCGSSTASIGGDPHVRGAHGDVFDFKGAHGGIYVLLSTQQLSLSARFEHETFMTPHSKLRVHGSWIRQVYWTVRTAGSKLLKLQLDAHWPSFNRSMRAIDDLRFAFDPPRRAMRGALTVSTPAWRTRATVTKGAPHWGKLRIDVTVLPLRAKTVHAVAPHGLLGQTYDGDGIPIHGKKDSLAVLDDGRPTNSRKGLGGVVTTRAQGEGAIEGTAEMYRVRHPFDTSFAFSRFGAITPWPVRNVTQLQGYGRG